MNTKKYILAAFVVVALAQLFVPVKMIWDREDIIKTGTEYKFITAPVDPSDPFRGKYITLNYMESSVAVPEGQEWMRGEAVYVSLTADSSGYARISSASKTEPIGDGDYFKAAVRYEQSGSNMIAIDIPFDRYYMEESKAYDAELEYRDSQLDTSTVTYALVSIKEGDAVLKDVMIDGISIRDIVKENQRKGSN